MAEAITNSLRFMTPDDIHAMIDCICARSPRSRTGRKRLRPIRKAARPIIRSAQHVFNGGVFRLPFARTGRGVSRNGRRLPGDQSAGDPAGVNTLQILAHGSELETGTGEVFMHSFAGAYTDEELAAVTQYVTQQFAGRDSRVTAEDVKKAKATAN